MALQMLDGSFSQAGAGGGVEKEGREDGGQCKRKQEGIYLKMP